VNQVTWVSGPKHAFKPRTARLVVPVPPEGWLTLGDPLGRAEPLAMDWRAMAQRSVEAANLPVLARVHAEVFVQPAVLAPVGEVGIHAGEDCRPSWTEVRVVLAEAGVRVVSEGRMRLRVPLNDLLVVELTEVSGA
jgi:hypothetical protein